MLEENTFHDYFDNTEITQSEVENLSPQQVTMQTEQLQVNAVIEITPPETSEKVLKYQMEDRNLIEVIIDGYPVKAMIDTGASISLISAKLLTKIKGPNYKMYQNGIENLICRDVNEKQLDILGKIDLTVYLADVPLLITPCVTPSVHGVDILLGLDFITANKVDLKYSTHEVEVSGTGQTLLLMNKAEYPLRYEVVLAQKRELPPNSVSIVKAKVRKGVFEQLQKAKQKGQFKVSEQYDFDDKVSVSIDQHPSLTKDYKLVVQPSIAPLYKTEECDVFLINPSIHECVLREDTLIAMLTPFDTSDIDCFLIA